MNDSRAGQGRVEFCMTVLDGTVLDLCRAGQCRPGQGGLFAEQGRTGPSVAG